MNDSKNKRNIPYPKSHDNIFNQYTPKFQRRHEESIKQRINCKMYAVTALGVGEGGHPPNQIFSCPPFRSP